MNPARRFDWKEAFRDCREWLASLSPAQHTDEVCRDCGSAIYLVCGRHSHKWFYSHAGLAGCESARAIMFDTKEQAQQATEVFK